MKFFSIILALALTLAVSAVPNVEVDDLGRRCVGPCGQGRREIHVRENDESGLDHSGRRCVGPCGQGRREILVRGNHEPLNDSDVIDEIVEYDENGKRCLGACGVGKRAE